MKKRLIRLKKREDFRKTFKEGKGFKENFLFLKKTSNGLDISRFAFTVGKKASRKASVRNRIKRKIRESVRTNINLIKEGADVIFIAGSGFEEKDTAEIETVTEKLLKKSGLIKSEK